MARARKGLESFVGDGMPRLRSRWHMLLQRVARPWLATRQEPSFAHILLHYRASIRPTELGNQSTKLLLGVSSDAGNKQVVRVLGLVCWREGGGEGVQRGKGFVSLRSKERAPRACVGADGVREVRPHGTAAARDPGQRAGAGLCWPRPRPRPRPRPARRRLLPAQADR